MSKRAKEWAKRRRQRLLDQLGGKCVECSAILQLTFDVLVNSNPLHHGMDASARMCYYVKEWRKGNLQILCASCHARQGKGSSRHRTKPGQERIIKLLRSEAS